VHEDNHANTEVAPSSAGNSLASTAYAPVDDDVPDEVQDDSSDSGDETDTP
jgi:hypothetical protein